MFSDPFDEKAGPMWPQQTVLDVETKSMREQFLAQFWKFYVKDEFDVVKSSQAKVAFFLKPLRLWIESAAGS